MDTKFLVFVVFSLLLLIIAYQVAMMYIFARLKRIEKLITSSKDKEQDTNKRNKISSGQTND